MAYQYIEKEKISKGDYKTAFLLSDGKRWHDVSPGIVKNTNEFIKHEIDKMAIAGDKTLLILNPVFFQEKSILMFIWNVKFLSLLEMIKLIDNLYV